MEGGRGRGRGRGRKEGREGGKGRSCGEREMRQLRGWGRGVKEVTRRFRRVKKEKGCVSISLMPSRVCPEVHMECFVKAYIIGSWCDLVQ